LVGVGVAYSVARWGGDYAATRYLPSSMAGFAAAFLTYVTLAAARLEPAAIAIRPKSVNAEV